MINFLPLEFRKNTLLSSGLAATFAASVPLVAGVAWLVGRSVAEAVTADILFWTLAGLPGIFLLFGAVGSSALRREPMRSSELALPISPVRRSTEAVGALVIHACLIASLIVAATFVDRGFWRQMPIEPVLRAYLAWLPVTALYFLLLSFAAAYLIADATLGALAGLLIGGICVLELSIALALQREYRVLADLAPFSGLAAAVSLLAAGWAVRAVSWRVERAPASSRAQTALIAAAFLTGPVLAGLCLWCSLQRVAGALEFVVPANSWHYNFQPSVFNWFPQARGAASSGALLESGDGELVWVDPSGRRQALLPGLKRGIGSFIERRYWSSVHQALWDKDGTLYVLVNRDDGVFYRFELWSGRPGASWRKVASVPEGDRTFTTRIVWLGEELGLMRWGDAQREYIALSRLGNGRWTAVRRSEYEILAKRWLDEGKLAVLDKSGRVLRSREGTWRLPFAADPPAYYHVAGVGAGKDRFFPVVVFPKKGEKALAICRAGGQVDVVWPGAASENYTFQTDADGLPWRIDSHRRLFLVAADGRFLPPVDLSRPLRDAQILEPGPELHVLLLHRAGDSAWLLAQNRYLIRIDLRGGRLEKTWKLSGPHFHEPQYHPDDWSIVAYGPDGFYYHGRTRLYFVDWNGTRKDLGPA